MPDQVVCPQCGHIPSSAAASFCGKCGARLPPVKIKWLLAFGALIVMMGVSYVGMMVLDFALNTERKVEQNIRTTIRDIQTPPTPQPLRKALVSMSHYNQLSPGMSYTEVVQLVGDPGTQLSYQELAGYVTYSYSWQNPDGSNLLITFQNHRLVNKAQSMLP